jgi:hypothetical protein
VCALTQIGAALSRAARARHFKFTFQAILKIFRRTSIGDIMRVWRVSKGPEKL